MSAVTHHPVKAGMPRRSSRFSLVRVSGRDRSTICSGLTFDQASSIESEFNAGSNGRVVIKFASMGAGI